MLAELKRRRLKRFIRVKEEVDKEAMLREPATATSVKGVSIGQREEFVVKPAELAAEIASACAQVPRVGVAHPALGGGVNPADIAACEAQARMQAGDPALKLAGGAAVGALGGAAAGAAAGAIGGAIASRPGMGAGYARRPGHSSVFWAA